MSEPLLEEQWLWPLLTERARRSPDRLMLVDQDDRRFTFGQIRALAERVAAGLAKDGLSAGSTVAWQLPTTVETIVLSLAVARLGAVQVPIIPIYREREVGFILRQTGADALITRSRWRDVDYAALADQVTAGAAAALGRPVRPLVLDRDLPEGEPSDLADWAPPGDDRPGWCYYTSGTTADPKGVRHRDRTLLAGAAALGQVIGARPDDVGSIAFPVAHIGGADYLGMVLQYGMPALLVEQFAPAEAVALFRRHQVTLAGGTTAFYTALLDEHRRHPQKPFVPSLRLLCGGGAPKPPAVFHQVLDQLGVRVVHGWAMTECPMICCGRVGDDDEQLAHTEGRPVPGAEVKVVDQGLIGDGPGEGPVGRLLVRGSMLFCGYVDPRLDDGVFDAGGWFDTGDLGYLRGDGHLVIAGRSKDVIIRKGETLSAREIEDVLFRHPDVADVAVVGLPDADRGELVCAVVQPARAGSATPDLGQLVAFGRAEGLIAQKLPERVVHLDELPRNALGKVVKTELRRRLAQ